MSREIRFATRYGALESASTLRPKSLPCSPLLCSDQGRSSPDRYCLTPSGAAPLVPTPTWSTYTFTTCVRSSTRVKNLPGFEPCMAPAIPSTRDRNTQDRARLKGQNRYRKPNAREDALAPDDRLRGHLCAHPTTSGHGRRRRLLAGADQPTGHTAQAGGQGPGE